MLLSQESSRSGEMCQRFAHQTWHRLSPRRGLGVPGALGGLWLPVFTHSSDGGTGGSVPCCHRGAGGTIAWGRKTALVL